MAELFQSAYFALSPKKSAHYFSRWGHTAIPISNQLYCFGGKKPNTKSKDNDPYYKIDSYTLEVQKVQAQGLFSTDSHSTIRIGGKILLWGGMKQQQGTNRCYRFDIDNDTWTQVKQFGEIPPPRDSHCVENINNRWMLLFGGNTTKELPKTANDFYLLDTISMKWKKVNIIKGIIPAFRQDATLTAVGKHFYLFGGMGKQQIFLNDLYKITLNNPDFTVSQPQIFIQQIIISGTLPSQRANHSAVQYKNRFLVVFSGQGKSDQLPLQKNDDDSDKRSQDMLILRDVWVFDSEKINWFQLKPKNSDLYKGRISFTATLFRDCILLVGGLKTLRNTHKNILVLHIKQPHPLVTQLQQGPKSKLERSTSQYTSQKHQILKQRKHIVRYKQNALNQYNQNPRLIVTQSFLQSMTKSIRNPIRAIGLIVEEQVDLGALYINIKIKNSIQIHSHNQKYIIINTDSKKWQYQQFLKVMCSLDIRPKDIIKKNKQEIQYKQQMDQELQITRKFGTLIKLCSLRLGRSFIYITKQKLNTIAFSISSKYQDPEITPFFFSQQLNIPLTNIRIFFIRKKKQKHDTSRFRYGWP